MSGWITVVVAGLGTYLIRGSFIWLHGRWVVPPLVARALRFVPPAVLAALIAPAVVAPRGIVEALPPAPELLAALAAAVVAWRTRSIAATIAVGLPVLWAIQALT